MTLRLVLVSLVAAMGLTVPSAPVIESWVASTQNWMNARFADWDTRCPQTADYVIVNDYYDVARFAPRPESSSPPASILPSSDRPALPIASSALATSKNDKTQGTRSDAPRSVLLVAKHSAFEPTLIGEPLITGIAYKLNLKNEGIDLVPPAQTQKPATPARLDVLPVVTKVYRAVQLELAGWSRTLASVLPRVVFPVAGPRAVEPLVAARDASGPGAQKLLLLGQGIGINPRIIGASSPAVTSFGTMEASANLYFAGELSPLAKTMPPARPIAPKLAATPVAVRLPASPAATETRDLPNDLDIEVAGELVRQDDGFGTPRPARVAPVLAATPGFDPLEVGDDSFVGTAFELNFRNDGLHKPAEPVVHTVKADPPMPQSNREISRAVKLTREAVYAWVNIFTGPALVTVSQSN